MLRPLRCLPAVAARRHGTGKLRGCHLVSLRVGDVRAIQLLLGHSKPESTVRHLGIEVDDALQISERTEA